MPFGLVQGIRRQCPVHDIRQVSEFGAPTKGTEDSDLLLFCETERRIFVSGDRSTVRQYISKHRARGHNTYGVALISRGYSFARIVDDLLLILECSDADEWINDLIYVPSLAKGE